jgi:Domain of unknown function (DU1801)
MAENKTKPTRASVSAFLATLEPDRRRNDATELHDMLTAATGETAEMWGTSIVGYGRTRYVGSSGRGTDWFPIGFSPRKTSLVLYSTTQHGPELLAALGKHKRGVGCLYITKLDDIDRRALRALINGSVKNARS